MVQLGRGNKFLVHRLVLLAFVGPCPEGCDGLHGPGGHTDNRLVNLYWGTPIQNMMDKYRDGTRGGRLDVAKVIDIRLRASNGEALSILAREFDTSYQLIWQVVRRKIWKEV